MNTMTLRQADIPFILPGESDEQAHMRIALEQSALYSTRLAIARWSSGISSAQMQVNASLRLSPQARWYAGAQSNFQAWLELGGFSQQPQQQDDSDTHQDQAEQRDVPVYCTSDNIES